MSKTVSRTISRIAHNEVHDNLSSRRAISRRFFGVLQVAVFFLLFSPIATVVHSEGARHDKLGEDFGAEQIEPDTTLAGIKPLSPSLVEEPNSTATKSKTNASEAQRQRTPELRNARNASNPPPMSSRPSAEKRAPENEKDGQGNTDSTDAFTAEGSDNSQGIDNASESTGESDGQTEEVDISDSNDSSSGSSSFLNVKDADIGTIVKTFSKITKRNFIVDSDVKGKITIHLPTPVSEEEALKIFDSVLLLKGFTTVPIDENTWKVVSAKDAKGTTIPLLTRSPRNTTDSLVTQLLRMKHVTAEDMQKVLAQFVSKDGIINAFTGTNSIIIIDSAANIKRLVELVRELDVPAMDQDISIIPVKHAEAKDISDKISKILGSDESSSGQSQQGRPNPNMPPAVNIPGRKPMPGASGTTVSKRALPLKIIPDERTNSIIVVADIETTTKVQALVEQLDSPVDLSGGTFHVYKLRHAKAEEVAEILNVLITGSGSITSGQSRSKGSSISRTRSRNATGSGGMNSQLGNYQSQSQQEPRSIPVVSTGGGDKSGKPKIPGLASGRVNFEGEISIAPDPSTNSLIINSSRTDYMKLTDVLKILDHKRRQVIVEATILEVSLTKEEGMGVELQGSVGTDNGGVMAQTNYGGLSNLLTNPAGLSDLTIAAASTGTLTLPGGITIPSQAFLVTALSRLANVNVLSAPNILTTDNQEAEIIVGENVPFVSSSSTNNANLNNTFNQIDRQDVGITLRITPQISTADFVTLNIFVEISNVVASTRNDPNGPTTTIRTTETVVEVKSNQMIVTGGLISDAVIDSSRGVPFLQDIPVLGQYFMRQDNNTRRTNLLIFITPKIINDQYDARESTVEQRDSLKDVIERNDSQPNRREILRRQSIDNVFETQDEPGDIPTTMTPPRDFPVDVPIEKPRPVDNSPIEFSIEPPTPGTTDGREKAAAKITPAEKPSTKIADQESSVVYVVTQETPDKKDSKKNDKKNGKANSKTPDSQRLTAFRATDAKANYFEPGSIYSNTKSKYVCLGVYDSPEQAVEAHPELSKVKWNKLAGDEKSWKKVY